VFQIFQCLGKGDFWFSLYQLKWKSSIFWPIRPQLRCSSMWLDIWSFLSSVLRCRWHDVRRRHSRWSHSRHQLKHVVCYCSVSFWWRPSTVYHRSQSTVHLLQRVESEVSLCAFAIRWSHGVAYYCVSLSTENTFPAYVTYYPFSMSEGHCWKTSTQ